MQAQFANQWMETLRHASQQMATPGKWEDKLSQGTEIVKQNMHNAMNHMKQASAALADTTYKSVDAMMSRMDEHLDETVTMARKAQNSKK
jgi:DNA helicase IV